MLSVILLVFAFVLVMVAAFLNPPDHPWRGRLICFGWACFFLSLILENGPKLLGK